MKKSVITVFLFVVFCVSVFPQNESDFITNGSGTITAYEGWDVEIVIPSQIGGVPVTAIANGVFRNMGLTSVTFPDSLRRIGNEAFASNRLTGIEIPDRVTVGTSAFFDNHLVNLTVGNNVSIGITAFANNGLTNITIGNGGSVSDNAFSNNRLAELTLGADINFNIRPFGSFVFLEYMCNERRAGTYNVSVRFQSRRDGDFRFIETRYGAVITEYTGNEGNRLIIPRQLGGGLDVKGIGDGSYRISNSISRMQLPDSIIFISANAFSGNQLTSITIPNSVTSIGSGAFSGNQLASASIGNSVVTIGNYAFSNNQLSSITIGNSVTSIGSGAFSGNNDEYESPGGNRLTSVTIPNSVITIGSEAFARNQITSVTIPDSVICIAGAFDTNTNINFGNRRAVVINMWRSWGASETLNVYVNGVHYFNTRANGANSGNLLFVNSGDEVVFYFGGAGYSQRDSAFVVYYSNNPPNPAFNPSGSQVDSNRVLLFRRFGDLTNAVDGELLGSFIAP